jgi:hypothetical protein
MDVMDVPYVTDDDCDGCDVMAKMDEKEDINFFFHTCTAMVSPLYLGSTHVVITSYCFGFTNSPIRYPTMSVLDQWSQR